jgi:hypothetical protein
MPVTSLARAVAACTAASAFAIAGVSPALAVSYDAETQSGADCACGGARTSEPSSQLFTAGTDVAAPDQRNPIPAQEQPVPQAAPTWPLHPATLTPARRAAIAQNADFQWEDAGVGAGGALAIVVAATGGAMLIRRRRPPDEPVPA